MTSSKSSTSVLPKHKWVETADGSLTLFSEEFQEACHSTTGAKTETLLHYIKGCKIEERLESHSPFTILEVGFGLGLGFETTLEVLKETKHPWHFISLELDRDLIEWWREKHPRLAWISENVCEMVDLNCRLTIVVGDARKVLPTYMDSRPDKFHAIYQDAFSPRRNPTLWTKEWFSFLKMHSASDVLLSTYSSSSSIRKSLVESGWKLTRGEKFGPKRTSTRASLTGSTDEEILEHLSRSPVAALSDDNVASFLKK